MGAEKLRVGLIGASVSSGWSPRAHIPALMALPEIELAALCTAHEETAREWSPASTPGSSGTGCWTRSSGPRTRARDRRSRRSRPPAFVGR